MDFAIYIASLHHYNCGDLVGKWLDITNLTASQIEDEIHDYMQELGVEEWAIHDHENLEALYSEYGMDWEKVEEYISIANTYSGKLAKAYFSLFDSSTTSLNHLQSVYMGEYQTKREFAISYLEETDQLSSIPEHLQVHFDYDSYKTDLFLSGFTFINGFVFADS